MESSEQNHSSKDDSPEVLPSLIKTITAHEVAGFDDSVQEHDDVNGRLKSTDSHPLSSSVFVSLHPAPHHCHQTSTLECLNLQFNFSLCVYCV